VEHTWKNLCWFPHGAAMPSEYAFRTKSLVSPPHCHAGLYPAGLADACLPQSANGRGPRITPRTSSPPHQPVHHVVGSSNTEPPGGQRAGRLLCDQRSWAAAAAAQTVPVTGSGRAGSVDTFYAGLTGSSAVLIATAGIVAMTPLHQQRSEQPQELGLVTGANSRGGRVCWWSGKPVPTTA
jgi:hypothetical protein